MEKAFRSAVTLARRMVAQDMARPTDHGLIWAAERILELEQQVDSLYCDLQDTQDD